jgi:hypothetical protein
VKLWYQSKTIIVNAIVAALVALEAGTGLLQAYLPGNFYTIIAVSLPVVNAILRVITTTALTASKEA